MFILTKYCKYAVLQNKTPSYNFATSFWRIMASSKKGETAETKKTSDPEDEATPQSQSENREEKTKARYVTRGNLFTEQQKRVQKNKDNITSLSIDEKRKVYKCRGKYTTLDKVHTWPEYYNEKLAEDSTVAQWWNANKKNVRAEVDEDLNRKMSLFLGDITSLEIDAIANAANESLLGGGGVDGAIHAASGIHLREECELLGGCQPGEAKITCGYKLPATHVIHTVGPRGEYPEVLKKCYVNSLNLMKEHKLKSIAFPCISTGIFGYPNLKAATVALSTIRKWLEESQYANQVDRIIMCLFLKKDVDIYHEQMQMFFPLNQAQAAQSQERETPSGTETGDTEEKKSKV